MKFQAIACFLGAGALTACTTSSHKKIPGAKPSEATAAPSRATAPAAMPAPAREKQRSKDLSAPLQLRAFEVRESAFSDFGMSVRTNFEVQWGGRIEWMLVSAIAPQSSAATIGLVAGDRIMAIDGRPVTDMDRAAMLESLFQRKKGDRTRLLILRRDQIMPNFVSLVASRPG